MAMPPESLPAFRLFVTHVDSDGPFLKISGQVDHQASLMIESLFDTARENLEQGLGAVSPAAIHEGVICAAKYRDGTYYRAKVINTNSLTTGLVGVHFIDYGNKDIISISAIRFFGNYDPLFLELRGQATEYYLSEVINPSGKWEETLLLKLQSLLCYGEYTATYARTRIAPIISIQFKGTDLSAHIISIRFGVAISLAKQEALLLQLSSEKQQIQNWQPSFVSESSSYLKHTPFLMNQNFPLNPASTMRIQQNVSLPFNGSIQATSSIGQRLLVNKASRNPVNLRAPVRQPQHAPASSMVNVSTPPPALMIAAKPTTPKKSSTYKSRLLEANSQHKVFVSYAEEGPELFTVQLATDANKLQDMMDDINKRPHSSLTEPPMIGTLCLGRMSGDRIICRAIVMNLSGSQCKLFFVDFGDTEMVSYYDIFDIPEEFVKPNVFAMRFCLSGVKKLEKGPHLNEAFKQLVNGKVMVLKVVAPEGPPLIQYGELFLDNKNVLDLLMDNIKDKLQFKWIEMLPLGSRHSVLVSYVDSCIKFFVQLSAHIDELNAVMDAVRAHCENSSSPGDLPVGAACCARFPDDSNWYRARVRDTRRNKVVVVYVDYGNEQEVEVSDLRTITSELMKLPSQAMKCALKGYENGPVETKTSNQLEMLALEKTLTAHIVGILSTTMVVSLIDETVSPPLDIARKMTQLSQPRSSHEIKATTPVRKDAPESFSSSESVSDDGKKKSFRREKSFKDEWRPPREDNNEEFPQRGGRDNREGFDRSGPGRHSEKFGGRPERGERPPYNERRGGPPKPRENAAPTLIGDDEWESPPAQPTFQPHRQNRDRENNPREQEYIPRERENKYRHDDRTEKGSDDWGNRPKRENRCDRNDRPDRPDRRDNRDNRNNRDNRDNRDSRDNRGDRRDHWGDKKENWNQKREFRPNSDRPPRNNFSSGNRADNLFGSDDKKSDKSFRSQDSGRAPPYKGRSKFTQVQYKELAEPVPLDTPFPLSDLIEPGAQHEVSVTWIISPENFYAQIMSLQPKFLEMMHKIPEIYKGVKSFTGEVPIGGSVLARYPDDGVLYRATIESVQPFSKFIVRYVDFGNKQLVDAKDIWQMDRQMMELPKMAVCCSLTGVVPVDGEWKPNNLVDMCFNAPRYQCVFQENVDDIYKVSLWNNGVSVADMLVEKELAKLSEHQSSVTLKDEAIDLTIIVGQQILCRVTHVESFEKFYVQLDMDKATLVEEAIANFDTSKLTPLTADSLADGVHCTLKQDGKIYRAILQDVSDPANIKAVMPDYGKSVTTALENIMILPTELSVYYYQSLECCLNNYTAESNQLMTIEELQTKLTGNKVIVYINHVEGITLVTTLYDCVTGHKIAVFEPDEGAYDKVIQLCMRAVFNYNFGMAYIVHMENFNEFYLQKASDGDRIALLLDDLYNYYEGGTPQALTAFEVDGICVAHSADGNWYRASIISVEDTQVKVQYPDYGNTETLPKESLKVLDPKFYEPCALALVASLGLIALQEDALLKLKEWTNEMEVQVTLAVGTDGWLANLHLDGVDLSMKLVSEKLATPQISSEEEEQKVEEVHGPAHVEPTSLPDGCTQVYISHIDTPGHFWLQMADKVDTIENIQAELQSDATKYSDIANTELGTWCVAKYLADDQWYRAEILDSDSDITTIRFIDYGNTDVLDNQPGLIKEMPEKFKGMERYAVKSSVNAIPTGNGEWSESSSNYFTQLVGDLANPVDALIVLKDVTTYVDIFVNGQNLTDKLVSEGYATRSEETDCGDLPSCFASHVNSPSEFWIQLETATPELQAMEAAMVDAENFPELIGKEEGVICAAKYPEDGAWYRAQVIVDGSEGTEVLFMDYGNASIANELRSLPDELKIKPALSRKCALQKPRDIKWSRQSETKFNELAAEGATIFNVQFIASGDISIVELFLAGTSVTEELVGLCDTVASVRIAPVGQEKYGTGKICYVTGVDEFYVHLDDVISNLDKVTVKMNESPEFEPASELKVGSVCAAFWAEDEQWYRSKILEFCDVGYHVHFMDYGNKAKCEEFRQLPEDLAAIEPLARCCRLVVPNDDPALMETGKTKLDELTLGDATISIEFLDSTTHPALVKLTSNGKDFYADIKPADQTTTDNTEELNTSAEKEIKKAAKECTEEAANELHKAADELEDGVNEQSEHNTSQADLDESMESNHIVIGNKSFESKADSLSEEIAADEVKDDSATSPEKNISAETLEDSHDTVKTLEEHEFSDCVSSTNTSLNMSADSGKPVDAVQEVTEKSEPSEKISEAKKPAEALPETETVSDSDKSAEALPETETVSESDKSAEALPETETVSDSDKSAALLETETVSDSDKSAEALPETVSDSDKSEQKFVESEKNTEKVTEKAIKTSLSKEIAADEVKDDTATSPEKNISSETQEDSHDTVKTLEEHEFSDCVSSANTSLNMTADSGKPVDAVQEVTEKSEPLEKISEAKKPAEALPVTETVSDSDKSAEALPETETVSDSDKSAVLLETETVSDSDKSAEVLPETETVSDSDKSAALPETETVSDSDKSAALLETETVSDSEKSAEAMPETETASDSDKSEQKFVESEKNTEKVTEKAIETSLSEEIAADEVKDDTATSPEKNMSSETQEDSHDTVKTLEEHEFSDCVSSANTSLNMSADSGKPVDAVQEVTEKSEPSEKISEAKKPAEALPETETVSDSDKSAEALPETETVSDSDKSAEALPETETVSDSDKSAEALPETETLSDSDKSVALLETETVSDSDKSAEALPETETVSDSDKSAALLETETVSDSDKSAEALPETETASDSDKSEQIFVESEKNTEKVTEKAIETSLSEEIAADEVKDDTATSPEKNMSSETQEDSHDTVKTLEEHEFSDCVSSANTSLNMSADSGKPVDAVQEVTEKSEPSEKISEAKKPAEALPETETVSDSDKSAEALPETETVSESDKSAEALPETETVSDSDKSAALLETETVSDSDKSAEALPETVSDSDKSEQKFVESEKNTEKVTEKAIKTSLSKEIAADEVKDDTATSPEKNISSETQEDSHDTVKTLEEHEFSDCVSSANTSLNMTADSGKPVDAVQEVTEKSEPLEKISEAKKPAEALPVTETVSDSDKSAEALPETETVSDSDKSAVLLETETVSDSDKSAEVLPETETVSDSDKSSALPETETVSDSDKSAALLETETVSDSEKSAEAMPETETASDSDKSEQKFVESEKNTEKVTEKAIETSLSEEIAADEVKDDTATSPEKNMSSETQEDSHDTVKTLEEHEFSDCVSSANTSLNMSADSGKPVDAVQEVTEKSEPSEKISEAKKPAEALPETETVSDSDKSAEALPETETVSDSDKSAEALPETETVSDSDKSAEALPETETLSDSDKSVALLETETVSDSDKSAEALPETETVSDSDKSAALLETETVSDSDKSAEALPETETASDSDKSEQIFVESEKNTEKVTEKAIETSLSEEIAADEVKDDTATSPEKNMSSETQEDSHDTVKTLEEHEFSDCVSSANTSLNMSADSGKPVDAVQEVTEKSEPSEKISEAKKPAEALPETETVSDSDKSAEALPETETVSESDKSAEALPETVTVSDSDKSAALLETETVSDSDKSAEALPETGTVSDSDKSEQKFVESEKNTEKVTEKVIETTVITPETENPAVKVKTEESSIEKVAEPSKDSTEKVTEASEVKTEPVNSS